MDILALDSVGGASGDMLLAALVDLGADFDRIAALIQTITPEPLSIARMRASDAGLHGTRLTVAVQAATAWIAPQEPVPTGQVHASAHDHAHEADAHGGHPAGGGIVRDPDEALRVKPVLTGSGSNSACSQPVPAVMFECL